MLAVVLVLNLFSVAATQRSAVAQERPALTYFALGDSYSSGHGLEGDVGADKKGEYGAGDARNCRRSPSAYPYLVARALSETYTVDFGPEHHLACSGATAGPYTMRSNDKTYHIDKSISRQVAEVYRFLDERDSAGNSDPVLVTITIGANDVGLTDWITRGQVSRQFNTAYGFFQWLDAKEMAINAGLTPAVHGLLAHENVSVILTDYPNPFPEGLGSSFLCNDFVLSMSCEEALQNIVSRLNLIMVEQFLAVSHTMQVRVVSLLGEPFSNHPASGSILDCLRGNSHPDDTWFQNDCAHPNQEGARAIADAVVERAKTMLPPPVTAPPTEALAGMDIGAYGPNGHEIGARFTVTTEDGTSLGSCTLEGERNASWLESCRVSVPRWTTVVVTLDESTITPGTVPVENPLYFETSGDPGAASHWGVTFQIEPQSPLSASTWPTDRDDGPGPLYVWLGANMHGFPDWVACDDAATYCLVGYSGEEHMLVQMSGLDVVGTVADSAADPRQALLALGLPDEIVTQILGQIETPGTTADAGEGDAPIQVEPTAAPAPTQIPPTEPTAPEAPQRAEIESMSIIPVGPDGSVVGVGFTVTTEDGTFLGACAVAADFPDGYIPNCSVDVPRNTIVAVWFDPSSSTTGLTPVENPVYFDTSSNQDAQMWGPAFEFASAGASDGNESSGGVDVALITHDPDDGDLLTGACYVLVDFSNEGCDENGDGQVTFADIPFGTYTVRQTQTPAGYPTINDYDITVAGTGYMEAPSIGVPLGFVVKQAPEQNAPNTRNVSIVFLDMLTHERVTIGACVEIVGASLVGCDRDLIDGQVDFLDVPAGGPYELSFSNLPSGYEVGTVGGPLAVTIDVSPGAPANVIVFVLLAGPDGAGSDSGGVIEPDDGGSGTTVQGSATLEITLRACPEGIDPNTADPTAVCTIPLDAPDLSRLSWDGGQDGMAMPGQDRLYDGTYSVAVPASSPVSLVDFEPVVRDAFLAVGADGDDQNGDPVITLADGATRHIFIYYYVSSSGGSSTEISSDSALGEATLLMTFRGCPEGFNPNSDDFFANCTIPLDAPDASIIHWGGDGQGGMNITGLDRQYNGEYVFNAGPGTMNVELSGLAPVVRNAYQVIGADGVPGGTSTVNLVDGETREVSVFYYST